MENHVCSTLAVRTSSRLTVVCRISMLPHSYCSIPPIWLALTGFDVCQHHRMGVVGSSQHCMPQQLMYKLRYDLSGNEVLSWP